MNAFNTPTPGTVHESQRTSVSKNVDPTTGRTVEMLRTTRLEMRQIGKSLVIRFGASEHVLQANQPHRLQLL